MRDVRHQGLLESDASAVSLDSLHGAAVPGACGRLDGNDATRRVSVGPISSLEPAETLCFRRPWKH